MGVLTVKVIKATNLADKDFVGKTDPYVEITLEQDNMVRVFFFVTFCLFVSLTFVSHMLFVMCDLGFTF